MSKLINDILQHIFEELKVGDLLQCQLTCNSWYTVATGIIYKTVKIKKERNCVLFFHTIENSEGLGELVKSLHLPSLNGNEDANPLDCISKACPYITRLMSDKVTQPTTWLQLMHLRYYDQKFLYLKYLPRFSKTLYNQHMAVYSLTAFAFRDTLKVLYLIDCDLRSNHVMMVSPVAAQKSIRNLKEFKNLEHLIIRLHVDDDLKIVNSILQYCPPTLTSVDIRWYPRPNMPSAQQQNNQFNYIELLDLKQTTTSNFLIKTYPNIKRYSGYWNMPIENDESLRNFMTMFPSLNELEIISPEKYPGRKYKYIYINAFQNISSQMKNEFFEYLRRIPKTFVDSFSIDIAN